MAKKKSRKKEEIYVSFVDEPASEQVTGSMVYIRTPYHQILLDAGFCQTNDIRDDYLVNRRQFKEFKAKEIDYIFLSHNHGDHIFETPVLYQRGCRATTIIPTGNKPILQAMMRDCLYINERDAELLREKYKKNYPPLFEEKDLSLLTEHIQEYEMQRRIKLDDHLSFQLFPSGHLKGGCQIMLYITLHTGVKKILYTGDLGNPTLPQPFVETFVPIKKANLVIGESTYGDKPEAVITKKEREKELRDLKEMIQYRVSEQHGRVIIPVFAQQRAQNLAWYLYEIFGKTDFPYHIYVDSPLACEIFRLFDLVSTNKDKQQMKQLLNWKNLKLIRESTDSQCLTESLEPCVILSSSGMCNHGRVKHHIKHLISDKNATILFCGYSADGTLASLLKDSSRNHILIDAEDFSVQCECHSFHTMSSHMPFQELVKYYTGIQCETLCLHHGNQKGKVMLKDACEEEYQKLFRTTHVKIADKTTRLQIR